jgi:hypothetical protein
MELTTLLNRTKVSVSNLSIYEHRILAFLLARVNKDKLTTHGYLAWPGTDDIIEFTGISKSTIERSRTNLVKTGWMQYTPGHGAGSSNHYYINAHKIVSCYVGSGYNRPAGDLYATNVSEKSSKRQGRNTAGLMQGKEAPKPAPKPEPTQVPVEPVKAAEDKPGPNPDGSPPWWSNGMRRYSWGEDMPPSKDAQPSPQSSNIPTYYEEDLDIPF